MTTTMTMTTAKDRQLDWLLGEVLGGASAAAARPLPTRRARGHTHQHLVAAAVVTFAVATAFGVALLRRNATPDAAAQPQGEPVWYEVHDARGLGAVPADVQNLRCFDFDDAALAELAKATLPRLERLDLGAMAVNDQGYSVSLKVTDAGVASLGKFTGLRWLSLASCEQLAGPGLAALEALPRLEHLDLTYTKVDSAALERLPRLPSLRELVLSHCMQFHGRSLAAVAKIPGLRRLELQGCTTVAADDVKHLANLRELRHLDLRDCQGRFRGQTMFLGGEVPADLPKQDGIGVTDASIAALAGLPLETLRLGGAESLTDAIGDTLAKLTTLRTLDLANLPKATGALLAKVPPGLVSLSLDDNPQFDGRAVQRLPKLPSLRELGISGLPQLTDDDLRNLLAGHSLTTLRLAGASTMRDKGAARVPADPKLTAAVADLLAQQRELQQIAIGGNASWADARVFAALAQLPDLREIDAAQAQHLDAAALAPLGASRSLQTLRLVWCMRVDRAALAGLAKVPLRELDVYGTNLQPDAVREVAAAWPGCVVKMPKGQRYRVPAAK